MSDNKTKKLFSDFPPVSRQQWEDQIRIDLKGADYDKRLVWKTPEGIPIRPYYTDEDLKALNHLKSFPEGSNFLTENRELPSDWLVREDIRVNDPGPANESAIEALMKGAGSIGYILDDKTEFSQKDISRLLKDICLASAEINFATGRGSVDLLEFIDKENIDRGGAVSDLHGSIEYDPIGFMLTRGNFQQGEERSFDLAVSMAEYASRMPDFKVLNVNAGIFHNSGGSAVQELAFGLSVAAEYMKRLTSRGVSAELAAGKIKLTLATGSNYFMEIAKFRAARFLWAKFTEAWDLEPSIAGKLVIHATTSRWNKTIYDPYVNMLRSTTESMSAVLGGADSITVEPFDKVFREKSSTFSERIARNTQLVLKEEAYFDKVSDPAAGSCYIESLTGALIEAAWELFLQTDEKGGFYEAFKTGFIQDTIGKTASERDHYIASRRDVLLGTNKYPNPEEKVLDNIDLNIVSPGRVEAGDVLARPLRQYRGALPFEELRLKTERFPGGAPGVFLLTYGDPAMRKARAGFASGFFGCAGFRIIDNLGFRTPAEGAKASVDSGARIVVVCSSDNEYPVIIPEIAGELKDKAILVVAGYPKESIGQLEEAGVNYFIHMKSNILEMLKQFQQDLGIK